jgi:hypothetical protein
MINFGVFGLCTLLRDLAIIEERLAFRANAFNSITATNYAKELRKFIDPQAAKDFFYFKDGWRNYVSHGGDPYDEHQARSVLDHVRSFMSHLASARRPR